MVSGDELLSSKFVAYGPSHLVVLGIFAVGVLVLVALGRRQRTSSSEVKFSRVFACAIVAVTVPLQILQFLPDEWNPETSLPLQICDFAWVVAAYALWTHRPLPVTLTYLWGITLTSQGMITPDLGSAFPEPRFLMFWGMHVLIIWASFYLAFGLGIRPDWQRYRQAVLITFGWAVSVFVFNVIAGTNYGYVNSKPDRSSILDFLGPWPLYVVLEIAIVTT
ncbi:MAG: TIGR02206 family membrane protein, partial [Aeromicrobium sp.]